MRANPALPYERPRSDHPRPSARYRPSLEPPPARPASPSPATPRPPCSRHQRPSLEICRSNSSTPHPAEAPAHRRTCPLQIDRKDSGNRRSSAGSSPAHLSGRVPEPVRAPVRRDEAARARNRAAAAPPDAHCRGPGHLECSLNTLRPPQAFPGRRPGPSRRE